MKTSILSLFLILICHYSGAQTFNWAKQTGGDSSKTIAKSVAVDASGNIFTSGYFTDTVDFDPGAGVVNLISEGVYDIFITKSDASGNLSWALRIGSNGADACIGMTLDALGNIYFTGSFQDVVDFDPGAGLQNLKAMGKSDIFVCKLDNNGDYIWAKQISGTDDEFTYGLAVDASGDVYTTGFFLDEVDFDPGTSTNKFTAAGYADIFILKLNSSGAFIWARQFEGSMGNSFAYGYSIAVDAFKNVYTTGAFIEDVDFDPGISSSNLTTAGDFDIFISKLDSFGNFVFVKQIGSSNDDDGTSLALDANANIHFTGHFRGTVDFDPGTGTVNLSSSFSNDIFVCKLNSSGNFIWARKLGGVGKKMSNYLQVDGSGNVFTTGNFEDSVDFNPGTATYMLKAFGLNDGFISKLNPSGDFEWATQFGGKAGLGTAVEGSCLKVDNSGNIVSVGYFEGPADFDPSKSTYTLTPGAGTNAYIVKLGQCQPNTFNLVASTCSSYILNGQTYSSTGIYTQTLQNIAGCDSVITLTLTILKSSYSFAASACNSYTLNGQTYTTSGVYTQTIQNAKGCDSTIILTLAIKKSAHTLNVNACTSYTLNSQTYTSTGVYVQTLTNKAGCDSTLTLNLTISSAATFGTISPVACNLIVINSQTYTSSGVYTQNLTNKGGCDSTLTINLTINKSRSIVLTVSACDKYTLNGQTYSSSGLYVQNLKTKGNCDSVITLNLTITSVNKLVTQVGAKLTANASGAAYQWLDCNSNKAIIPGQISATFTAVKNGKYAVEVTQNSCKDTSDCYEVKNISVNPTLLSKGMEVYPNPTTGNIRIELNAPLQNGSLRVINLFGQSIMERTNLNGNSFSLDLESQADGIYFIETSNSGNVYRARVIKE